MKWLYRIIRLYRAPKCMHKYENYNNHSVKDSPKETASNVIYILRCTKCGEMKRFNAR